MPFGGARAAPNPEDFELVKVVALGRHGNRTPNLTDHFSIRRIYFPHI